jgi:O-antigen/teichoic acid export membrane protein
LSKIKSILQSNLFKITSLNSISVLIKICIGLVTSKILAVFVGPSGLALLGNFRNFISTIESVSTLGFSNGIVKYIAENQLDKPKTSKIISTVFYTLLIVSILLSCGLFVLANFWNAQIFGEKYHYQLIFKILALLLPWYATSVFFLAIINGFGRFNRVIFINIIGNIIGLLASLFMVVQFQTFGALLSIVITPALLFFATYYYINQELNLLKTINFKNFDFAIIKQLASFSLMALITALLSPFVFIAIRNNIIHTIGIEQAGFYETISRISSYYLLFITSILSLYFLPKLATAKTKFQTKTIFFNFYKILVPIFIIGLICIYFLRFFIIKTLFTNQFLPVTTLFFWQLIGDLLKVCSWILAYNLIAKKHIKAYIITEIFSLAITYFSSLYFTQIYGLQGVVIAHTFAYFIYLIVLIIYFKNEFFATKTTI